MSRALLAVLIVLVLGAAGVWWWGRPASSSAHDEALAPAPTSSAEPSGARAAASTERAPADGSATVDAIWREGRVVLPSGTPEDERVVVVARSSARFDGRELDEAREERVVADPDGSFRVAFAPGSLRGWLRIEARYLCLDERAAVSLAAEPAPIELRPWLGARIAGRVAGEDGAALEPERLAEMRVRLTRDGAVSMVMGGERELEGDRFEWNALDPGTAYGVEVRAAGLRPSGVEDLRLEAGETRELVLEALPARPVEVAPEVEVTVTEPPSGAGPLVTGRVVDGEDRPLPRFVIVASPRDRRRETLRQDFEDAQGRFELESLADGEWTLQAEAEELQPLGMKRIEAPEGARDLVLRMLRPARLAGVVRSPTGETVGRARVEVRPDPRGMYQGMLAWSDRADRDGRFEVDGIQPGRVLVVARAKGHGASALLAVDLGSGAAREDLELVLTAPGRITLELDPSIEPRRGRPVAVVPAAEPGLLTTLDMQRSQTDGEGRAELEDLAAGVYDVAFLEDLGSSPRPEHTERVTLAEGGFAHVVLGATDARPVVLHGTVRDGWTPRAGVGVSVLLADGARRRHVGTVTSDAEGNYELELSAPGRVLVTLLIDGDEAGGADFDVPAVERFQQALFVGRARIEGVVVDEAGAPLAGIQLLLTGDALVEDRFVESDAQGRFRIEHLPAGAFHLRYGQPFRRGDPALERHGRRVESVSLGAEDGVELRLVLHTAGAVEGRVLRADGSAPPFCRIEARDANDVLLDRLVYRVADPTGRFTIRGLDPGQVRLRAVTDEREGAWQEVQVLPDAVVEVVLDF